MNYLRKITWVLLLLGIWQFCIGQANIPKKILFCGNSYTYFWNLPQSVMVLADSKDFDFDIRQSTSGGTNLGQHWRGEKGLNTVNKIKEGKYDIVILQDHSMQAINHPDSLLYYGQRLADLAKESGAKPFIYMTWAREWDPYMQEEITRKYTELAQKVNGQLVPVGLAWKRAHELRPDLVLYDEDGSHPSPLGTYLTACMFYSALTGDSPLGLPHRIISTDEDGEKLYLNIQSRETTQFLQKVAEEIINKKGDN